MAKIVINACYGGFGLSSVAVDLYNVLSGENRAYIDEHDLPRHDRFLVQVVEELGEAANGSAAELIIEELPDGTEYRVDEYDGLETIIVKSENYWTRAA